VVVNDEAIAQPGMRRRVISPPEAVAVARSAHTNGAVEGASAGASTGAGRGAGASANADAGTVGECTGAHAGAVAATSASVLPQVPVAGTMVQV
jgi:hypothetical protein